MFNGQTGAAMSTVDYDPPRGTVSSWGDNYGNRVDRFLAGTAYLDGQRPSLIMARGYYTRTVIAAWDFRNGTLTRRWTFDSNSSGNSAVRRPGQPPALRRRRRRRRPGRDRLRRDGHRRQRRAAVEHRQRPRRRPARRRPRPVPRPAWRCSRSTRTPASRRSWMADARTGQILWQHAGRDGDNGRGVSGDIWAGSPGAESWSSARRRRCATPPAAEHRPQARLGELPGLVGRRPGPRAARRHPHRQVRHRRRHPAADRRPACTPTTAPRPPRRCPATSSATGARRSSGRTTDNTRAADLHHPDADRPRGSPP